MVESQHDNVDQETRAVEAAQIAVPTKEELDEKRRRFDTGPCFYKMLVSDRAAGCIIGRGGLILADINQQTGAIVRLSPPREYFPHSNERLVVCSGNLQSLLQAMEICYSKVVETEPAGAAAYAGHHAAFYQGAGSVGVGEYCIRLAVPPSAAGIILGPQGAGIRALAAESGCSVRVMPDLQTLVQQPVPTTERVIVITGMRSDEALRCAKAVVTEVQQDTQLRNHNNVKYDQSTPLTQDTRGQSGLQGTSPSQYGMSPQVAQQSLIGSMQAAAAWSAAQAMQQGGPGGIPTLTCLARDHAALSEWEVTIHHVIPASAAPIVIGRHGHVIKQIAAASGSRLNVSNQNDEETPLSPSSASSKRTVCIKGPLASVNMALFLVVQRLQLADIASDSRAGHVGTGKGGQMMGAMGGHNQAASGVPLRGFSGPMGWYGGDAATQGA